ncbi:VWA domain-containing protein [Chondromyces apiculatus]|uniref:VWFA domain-containing protein n=1 Tax=Chondromyces apiculatus DSM 436 TaxID=1192034 RepID=A0A017SVW3_9BACT|nr:VWA domain-containing protein [Chondromyces apiculatus]EYF01108.1 Hypothetical protein CAP_8613 [Chondromyces apiculatus DSM 436]
MQNFPRFLLRGLGILSVSGLIAAACSASGDGAPTPGASGDPGSAGPGGSGTTGTGGSGAAGGGEPGLGGGTFAAGTGGGGTGGSCAAVSSEAETEVQPADIIIAVDTSGSMDEEAAEVQANLNNFAALIIAANIDVHVILIADTTVCIPAPLGAGACPGADENLPVYRHVNQVVNSTDALQLILSTYPQWRDSLRPNATKTLAVVSDDNSDLSAASFTSQLLALDPPTFQGFKFDAIVAYENPQSCIFGCFGGTTTPCCPGPAPICDPLAAAEGTVYKQLVQQTGGVSGNLCVQDFDPVFASMATSVVTTSNISCEYAIPANPDGAFDPTKVNVEFTSGGGTTQTIGNVSGASTCTSQVGGWYYDDPQNPTKINLCPGTCTAVQGDTNGRVDVLFGCDTIPAVPQ